MNFLAHLHLSCADEDALLGNFMGDFVRNADLQAYPPSIQRGVFLHRQIDSFTDNHPMVRQGMRRLYPKHGKYASVLIDMYFDYVLASNWPAYSSEGFGPFIDRMYLLLSDRMAELPPNLQRRLPHMIADDWLRAYASLDGLRTAFRFLAKRVSKPGFLAGAVDSLEEHYPSLEKEFHLFYPDLQAHVRAWLDLVDG